MKPLIHVLEDDESVRKSLVRLLCAAGYETRAYISAGDFLLNPLPTQHGCILLDLNMPGPSGLDLQSSLQRADFQLPIIFLTAHADLSAVIRAMKAGAVDFLLKPVESAVLLEATGRALSRDLEERRLRLEESALLARFATLSPREREVFKRIVSGKLNKQIADDLGIAERTVKAQRADVLTKLQATCVADLGRFAEQLARCEKIKVVPDYTKVQHSTHNGGDLAAP
jgi:FixJ family two-component response regulator